MTVSNWATGSIGPQRRTVLLLAALLLLLTVLSAPTAGADADRQSDGDRPTGVNWLSYPDARDLARQQHRPMLLYFTGPSCDLCRKLERETFGDATVLNTLQDHFVAARIEARELPALSRKYRVDGLPVLWFVDDQGRALTSIPGYARADRFESVMRYVATGAYRTLSWQEWKDGKRPLPVFAPESSQESDQESNRAPEDRPVPAPDE